MRAERKEEGAVAVRAAAVVRVLQVVVFVVEQEQRAFLARPFERRPFWFALLGVAVPWPVLVKHVGYVL